MKGKNALILAILLVVALGTSALSYFGYGPTDTASAKNIIQGLDLSGGVYIVYEADTDNPTAEQMASAVSMIRTRVDAKGWTEADVLQEGDNRIRVEIPGVDDALKAIDEIGETAQLTFRDSQGNILVTGDTVADAMAGIQDGQIVVQLRFNAEGKEAFAKATQQTIGQPLYILMDETPISAPTVNQAITNGEAVITGTFTQEEAKDLADKIRIGGLPFKLNVLESNSVGATLGANALKTSVFAGIIGIALVILFMLLYYRMSGFAADWALVIYLALDLLILNVTNVTLTLPGIAGVILSVGMAVDANVIIFERIKEELAVGRTMNTALKNGFSRAFPAILDSNITTLISTLVLYLLGTGPIKGFAITLAIGIILSMFTALVITRLILNGLVNVGLKNPKLYGGK